MWSSLVLMTDSTVTHLILHQWWETGGIMGTGDRESAVRRAEVKIDGENLLFNRLALHFCSGLEWDQRIIIEGIHFAFCMLLVVCKFLQSAAGVNLQEKLSGQLPLERCDDAMCTTSSRGAWKREKTALFFKKKKKYAFYANEIKIHDPLPATIPAFPSRLQLLSLLVSSLGLASRYLS